MSLAPLLFDLFVIIITLSLVFINNQSYFILTLLAIIFAFYRHPKQIGIIILISFIVYTCFFKISIPNETSVTGIVKEVKDYQIIVYDKKIGYALFLKDHDLSIGDQVSVQFKPLEIEQAKNNGAFNEKNYYYGKQIFQKGQVLKYEKIAHQFSLRALFLNYLNQSKANECLQYLLAGNKSEEIQSFSTTLKSLSVLHLFAVSGMHFSLLKTLVSKLKNKFLSNLICLLYAICLEGNIAAWRAYLMMILRDLNYSGWNELDRFGLVGILFILYNPYIILNMSFIYTMGMYLAVILFKGQKFQWLYIYLVSLMLQAYFNYTILPLGILFSFVMTPYIEKLFLVFVLNCCLGFLLDPICVYLWEIVLNASSFLSNYSVELIIGKPNIIFVFFYFYTLVYYIHKKKKIYLLAFLAVIISLYISPNLRNYGEITMIDVGQGDCFLVSLPYQKANFLIDTGGTKEKDLATQTIIPYLQYRGIRKLDAVFISHEDFDHCGALDSLLENFNVREVIKEFQTVTIGNIEIKDLNQYASLDKNDGSQVLSMKIGPFECLFLGDASTVIEEQIVKDHPNLSPELVKISHHGSYTGTSNKLLETYRPKYALISCKKNNIYKHPSPIVISRLEAYGLKIYRSDLDGMVNIYFQEDTYAIEQ